MYKNLVKNKSFMLLSLGGFISAIGDYMYYVAITIALYDMTKSVMSIALMWLSRAVLRIPVQYLAGIMTDRYNKKKIISYANLISSIIAFLFIFADNNRIWLAYILAFLLQSLNDLDESSESAILPELVIKEELTYANSVFSVLQSICTFLSPALAGIIYKVYGSNILFVINAISFLIAGVLFSFIKYTHCTVGNSISKFEIFKSGAEGFKIILKYTDIKNMFVVVSMIAVLGRFYETYKVVIADVQLRIGSDGIIYFDYAFAIGGLLVPLILKWLSKYKQIKIFIIAALVTGIGFMIFGYSNQFIFTFIVLILVGIVQTIQGIYSRSIIQKEIPQQYIGRVFSFYKILLTAFAILGLIIADPLYKALGAGNSFFIILLVLFIICVKQLLHNDNNCNSNLEKRNL